MSGVGLRQKKIRLLESQFSNKIKNELSYPVQKSELVS